MFYFIYLFTGLLISSFIHLLIDSIAHSLVRSPAHFVAQSLITFLICPLTLSLIYSLHNCLLAQGQHLVPGLQEVPSPCAFCDFSLPERPSCVAWPPAPTPSSTTGCTSASEGSSFLPSRSQGTSLEGPHWAALQGLVGVRPGWLGTPGQGEKGTSWSWGESLVNHCPPGTWCPPPASGQALRRHISGAEAPGWAVFPLRHESKRGEGLSPGWVIHETLGFSKGG